MSKHTEGPWTLHTIKKSETGDNENAFRGPMAGDYALVGSDDTCPGILWGDWQYAEGNARLIAAAPELLEALKVAEEYMGDNIPGNSYGLCDNDADRERISALKVMRAAISKAEGK